MVAIVRRERWRDGRWRWVTRDEHGRFVTRERARILKKEKFGRRLWRVTAGINYTWAGEYRCFTYQRYFNHRPSDGEVNQVVKDFLMEFRKETRVDYDVSEWWFGDMEDVNVEVAKMDKYDAGLVGRTENYDREGFCPRKTREDVLRSMARKMIRTGKWFKQKTLEKWAWVMDNEEHA